MLIGRVSRAYLTDEQDQYAGQVAGITRLVWNTGLAQRQHAARSWRGSRRQRDTVGYASQCAELAAAKKDPDLAFLKDAPAVVLQQALKDLNAACVKHGAWRVKYRAKNRWAASFRYPNPADTPIERVNRRWGRVYLPKFGWVRFRWTQPLGGTPRSVTLRRDGTTWQVSILVDTNVPEPPPKPWTPDTTAGVDVGVANAVATHDGVFFDRDFLTPGEAARLKRLQQQQARQRRQPGWRTSKRYQRTRTAIQRITTRQRRRRSDFHHRTAAHLTTTYTLIGTELLDVSAMTRSASGTIDNPGVNVAQKKGLNKAILNKAWGQFLHDVLPWHAKKRGVTVIPVPAAYTSQQCPACHHTHETNRDSQAEFSCKKCGYTDHADTVGAINVRTRAIRLASPAPGLTPTRGATAPAVVGLQAVETSDISLSMKRQPSTKPAFVP